MLQHLADWYILLEGAVTVMPKLSRYTLGTKSLTLTFGLIELLVLALKKSGNSRLLILHKMDCQLQVLKITIRLLARTRAISDRRYAHFSEKLSEIGQELGGFIRAQEAKEARKPE
ncbi:MAG: four helix bundle protein [Patescibacteria group bacterium]